MPSYPPPPQVGFNNNVRHRGRVFHIQTEDSGIKRPHITTHLFVDGGHIVRSERYDYAHLLEGDAVAERVRQQMKVQHKAMFLALRDGKLDTVLDELFGPPDAPSAQLHVAAGPASSSEGVPLSARDVLSSSSVPHRPNPLLSRPGPPPRPSTNLQRSGQLPLRPSPPPAKRITYPPPSKGSTPESQSFPSSAPRARPSIGGEPTDPARGRPSARASVGGTLFRGKPVGEQSLDDVILSYITDDLDGPR